MLGRQTSAIALVTIANLGRTNDQMAGSERTLVEGLSCHWVLRHERYLGPIYHPSKAIRLQGEAALRSYHLQHSFTGINTEQPGLQRD